MTEIAPFKFEFVARRTGRTIISPNSIQSIVNVDVPRTQFRYPLSSDTPYDNMEFTVLVFPPPNAIYLQNNVNNRVRIDTSGLDEGCNDFVTTAALVKDYLNNNHLHTTGDR